MGSLFLRPDSIDHTPARLFYQKEVFLSAAEDKKFNLASVVGKCSVLFSKDYSTCEWHCNTIPTTLDLTVTQ